MDRNSADLVYSFTSRHHYCHHENISPSVLLHTTQSFFFRQQSHGFLISFNTAVQLLQLQYIRQLALNNKVRYSTVLYLRTVLYCSWSSLSRKEETNLVNPKITRTPLSFSKGRKKEIHSGKDPTTRKASTVEFESTRRGVLYVLASCWRR